MANIIEIKNLNFHYGKEPLYNNFNLTIEKGSWVSILGANGAGKSTLVKLLIGMLKSNNSIAI